jgi:hypothetical protein
LSGKISINTLSLAFAMAQNLSSYKFSYSVTRRFPFTWFTVLVVAEFVVALVLFSIISYATSGYEFISVYSTDPNATEAHTVLSSLPSFLRHKSRSACQAIEIGVGSSFSTNNSALSYRISSVYENPLTPLSSLVYKNHFLRGCKVNNVMILIESTDRNAAQ